MIVKLIWCAELGDMMFSVKDWRENVAKISEFYLFFLHKQCGVNLTPASI